jgi:hypothetical protein
MAMLKCLLNKIVSFTFNIQSVQEAMQANQALKLTVASWVR